MSNKKEDRTKKLLIVDDEEDMVWSLQKNLRNYSPDTDILAARSGEEALSILQKSAVDLIITDIRMPGISGLDLLLNVRQHYPQTGVIVMTAYPNPEFKRDAAAKGCLHFIEKPFDIHNLRKLIDEAFQSNKGFNGTVAGIDLTDIIQINCFSRTRAALRVKTVDREGTLYFKDGNIIHAICRDLEGEDAFYEILSFEGGTLESVKGAEPPAVTIDRGCEALLMEGLRRLDEKNKAKQEQKENEQRASRSQQSAKETVEKFASIEGVSMSCIISRTGQVLESISLGDINKTMAGETASKIFGASQALVNALAGNALDTGVLEYKGGSIIFSPVSENAFCLIVSGERADIVSIMSEMKKLQNGSGSRTA
ncbi:MAG: response regulator [bacterium]